MVTQISAASPSPNFHSGKSYFKIVFTFQQFVSTSHVKLRILNQKMQVWVFQGQDFAFRVAINISDREMAAKRVTPIYIFMFNKFRNCFTLVSNNIYWQKRLNWEFLILVFAKILMKQKYRLKIKHFLLKIGFSKPSFCQNIDKFWLQMQNNQCKHLMFGASLLSQELYFLLLQFINNKCSIYNNFL